MKKFIVFCILVASSSLLFSQNAFERRNQIKFSPMRTINLLNPGFELSFERKFTEIFSTQIAVAYLVDLLRSHDNNRQNYSGYRIMLEQKLFYANATRNNIRAYISLGTGYYSVNMISSAFFMPRGIELGDPLYYDSQYWDMFNLKRTGVIINVKTGVQFLINRVSIDFSFGLGIIIQNVTHTNRLNPEDRMATPRHLNVWYMTEREGRNVRPNFPFTLKIGYSF